jgi:three-Cys-motif partner protein
MSKLPETREAYRGREQTLIKHLVLESYIERWAYKLAGSGRTGRRVRIVYVDGFAGPWESTHSDLQDTSPAIALSVLNKVHAKLTADGREVEFVAIFIEANPNSFPKLDAFVRSNRRAVLAHTMHGEFGDQIAQIERIIGTDPALLFVDPTGWQGAAMKFIAPLVGKPRRDVLINVMYDYMNRFKDHPEEFLREQISQFFDGPVPADISEDDLMEYYREQLRKVCGLTHVADLIVQYPLSNRTYFRLVVGGSNREVVRLFREIEKKVIGEDAPILRAEAKEAQREDRGEGPSFGALFHASGETLYKTVHREAVEAVRLKLPRVLGDLGPQTYAMLSDFILEQCHIAEVDLRALLKEMRTEGLIDVQGMAPGDRTIKDHHLIAKGAGRPDSAGVLKTRKETTWQQPDLFAGL